MFAAFADHGLVSPSSDFFFGILCFYKIKHYHLTPNSVLHKPSLPGRDNTPPQRQECWLDNLTEEESRDIPELMKRIQALEDKGVTGESVAYSFVERRIKYL
ncbi:hypothetical protein C2845_PM13G08560 [Panicum miliaceum]|uniref:Transposase (putative) gypsy type domain-containing protein n=1 Tax=Panicum miliaceum TaxID=4540 RepID=A0A3L6RIW5_PANMI|nr:hypothetical protein C2845_PM13G08560 [Panicum miliaceum]